MKKLFAMAATLMITSSSVAFAQDAVIVEVPQQTRDYVIANPSDPVVIDGDLTQGYVIPQDVELRPIPDSPQYGYVYVNGQPVIVSLENRKVIYLSK
ncbi:DUF1236 domain-containing protein [Phyllobacterium sp. 628]|uniref:DUF1236 domain-containing protein n=1 Tax=Phyllobacterium sp. 628 TaxID=2718938 RepID=UPI0016626402|nr:DUF1236 domain-containing protein [Phyllobacterium sp. 628]QND51688.1 DUF1236 domain-containing protein [Phyllobacterium sp. 628]